MSYKEKRALISLVAVWIVGIGFGVGLWRHPPPTPVAAVPGVLGAFILLAGIMLVSYLALAIGVGFKEARRQSPGRGRRRA